MKKALAANEALAAKYNEALKGAEAAGAQNDAEAIALAAKAAGFEIAPEDVEKGFAEAQPLSQDDLEAVAGGSYFTEYEVGEFCIAVWHCYTALIHTETHDENDVACWSNNLCLAVNNGCSYDYSCVRFSQKD